MKKKFLMLAATGIFAIGLLTGCSSGSEQGDASVSGKTVTVSIDCKTILDNMDDIASEKAEFVPEDGWILEPTEVAIEEGDTVYDVLLEVCKENKIHMEHATTPLYNTEYIEGIAQLYEFDCGELSGWNFIVDGEGASYGADKIVLEGGETIEWRYTCDLGRDIDTYVEGIEE